MKHDLESAVRHHHMRLSTCLVRTQKPEAVHQRVERRRRRAFGVVHQGGSSV
jgi:hypothetical protein